MNSRRKFLLQGSMATTALVAFKPFKTIADTLSPVTGYRISNNSLVLAHTGNAAGAGTNKTLQHITKLRNNGGNLIMLHAGKNAPDNALHTFYDASMHTNVSFSIASGDYKIIYKGDIKTGVITAHNHAVSADSINALAVYLKEEKNCHVVICLSLLGYKTSTGLNDLELAAASTHLDIIMGGHATNFCTFPVIARNKNKEEVIINHTAVNALALRKIEIGFNNSGKKNQVSFTKTC